MKKILFLMRKLNILQYEYKSRFWNFRILTNRNISINGIEFDHFVEECWIGDYHTSEKDFLNFIIKYNFYNEIIHDLQKKIITQI